MAIERVFPTENDVGGTAGEGRVMRETNLSAWKAPGLYTTHVTSGGVYTTSARSYAVSGLKPSNGGGLNLSISAGTAIIEGFYVNNDATVTFALTPSTTNYVYLQLTKSGGLVTGASFVSGASDGTTSDALFIAKVATSGSAISDLSDERRFHPGSISGTYVGSGSAIRTIDLAKTPNLVIITGETESIFAMSAASASRERDTHTPASKYGFYISDTSEVTLASMDVLQGNDTWNPGTIIPQNSASKDITVTGAVTATGDFVLVSHTGLDGYANRDRVCFQGMVSSNGNVKAAMRNVEETGGSDAIIPNGTVYAMVFDRSTTKTVTTASANYTNATTGYYVPVIANGGFDIGFNATGPSLNESGSTYHFIAIL